MWQQFYLFSSESTDQIRCSLNMCLSCLYLRGAGLLLVYSTGRRPQRDVSHWTEDRVAGWLAR